MKTQALGWLAAAVLAAGLNSSYHNGGLQWAHEIAYRVQHNTTAVLALATGRADQFLAEARILKLDRERPECPLEAAMAQAERSFGQSDSEFDNFQAMSGREQAQLARIEANRARIEAQVQARLARIRLADSKFRFVSRDFSPVVVDVPQLRCTRVRVNVPRIPNVRVEIPQIKVPSPVVNVDISGAGPV